MSNEITLEQWAVAQIFSDLDSHATANIYSDRRMLEDKLLGTLNKYYELKLNARERK